MKKVKIIVNINLKDDGCRYGEDLDHFLESVEDCQGYTGHNLIGKLNEHKLHPVLLDLEIEKEYNDVLPTNYIIQVDGIADKMVVGNQIWMHTLVQELILLLK